MNVLMITGDRRFGPGHERYELQKSVVEGLVVVYWGRGSLWPQIPAGTFDVVTAQDPFWRGLFAWRVARRLGAKFNVQVHADLSGQSFIKHVLAGIILRRADSIRVVSERLKIQVEHFGARRRIVVLPVYIDLSKFENIQREPHEGNAILWVGRFETEKDPLQALEIFKDVRAKISDARLVMLGSGRLESALRQSATSLPVEFPGWQDTAAYLAKADVVLSTSRHESWGTSIVEALAAGVPVVVPDVGIAKEAGALVVAREKLADATIEALESGAPGVLKLHLLSKNGWAQAWSASL